MPATATTAAHERHLPHAGFLAMMLVFLALLAAGLAYTIDRNRQNALELHRQVAETRNRMFEFQVTRTFGLVETSLLTLAEQLEPQQLDRPGPTFTAQLGRALRFAPHLRSISLLDGDGYVIASTNPANLRRHPDSRGFQGISEARPGQLYIGLPWSGRDFADGQPLGLSPDQQGDGNGGFIAVSLPVGQTHQTPFRLIAAINSDYFINQFTLAINPHEHEIELARYDGRLLLSTSDEDNRRIGQPHRDMVYSDRLPQAEYGSLLQEAYDGRQVLSTYRASRQYPLLVISHTRHDSILARWQSETRLILTVAIPLLLALLVLGLWLHLELRQRHGQRSDAQARARQRLTAILDSLPAAVLVLDKEGRIEFANAVWQQYMDEHCPGLPGERTGMHYLELNRHLHSHGWSEQHSLADDIARLLSGQIEQSDQEAVQQHEPLTGDRSWRRVLGRQIDGGRHGEPSADDAPHGGALLMLVDITQQKKDTEQLRLAARIFDSTAEGLMITDAANKILWINPAFAKITGYSLNEVQGKTPALLNSGLQDRHYYQRMWDALQESGSWQGEIINRRKDGTVYPEWLTISALINAAGEITHYIAIFSDISERKASEDRIRHLSEHDFLTGLPNRLLFQDRLAQSIVQARRSPTQFALLFIDLDRFKSINDSLGHPVGDRLLQNVAHRLQQCIRSSDTLCRQGGDEFMVLLRDLQGVDDPARVAEKIIAALDRPFSVERHLLSITPSIGIALYPADGSDSDTLIRHAETAMYAAKQGGRNSYRFFHQEMNDHAASRLAIEEGLRRAIKQQEFELYYQPQVSIGSGKIVGIEALLRWHDPLHGLRTPDSFIPIAEESGQIVPIGSWVLRAACRQARAWRDAGLPPLPVSVNVAALQFATPSFIGEVEDALRDEGLDSTAIELEVTESMLLDTTDEVLAVLARLRQLGVRLSIDDFGTGYSSLSYLHKLPVDKLKVDRSFIHDLHGGGSRNSEGAKITEAIIRMAHSLGLNVIAEGVETFDQLEFLHRLGCDGYQGFFYSMPVTAPEIEVLLRKAGQEVVQPLVKQ